MPLSKKCYLFGKLVKNAKWWSKSNLPLSHSPDRKIFPFKRGFKKEKGTQYVYVRKPILDHNSLRFTYPPNYFNPQFKLVNKFGNLNNIKYSHNLCSCSKLSHLNTRLSLIAQLKLVNTRLVT